MRHLPLLLCLFCTCIFLPVIPASSQSQPSSQEPTYEVLVYEDGVPINPEIGISNLSKSIQLKVVLTDNSVDKYPYLKPSVIAKNLIANHIRNGKRIKLYPGDPSLNFVLLGVLQAGDRIVIELDNLRVETKDGMTRKLTRKLFLALPVYAEK